MPSCATTKTPFAASKDGWNTKEGTGKSMKNTLYIGIPKDTSRAEVNLNSEKVKPVALAAIELRFSERIS